MPRAFVVRSLATPFWTGLRAALVALSVGAGLAPARTVRANGAFPESFQLILPADRPHQIALATNFGLVISDDDGATWTWTCETDQTLDGSLYGIGPPPNDRFYSLSTISGLAYSDDVSCTWKTAAWPLDCALTTDFFPDPANPMRVLGMAQERQNATSQRVFASEDGGATFGPPIYEARPEDTLTGVESARKDPQTIYLAMYSPPGIHPKLVRSQDGGKAWMTIDLEPFLGQNAFRIIAVDPADPRTLLLRVMDPLGEGVALSRDGGDTFKKAFTLAGGVLRAYARLEDGTLFVAGTALDVARGFRSTDGGMTFEDWKVPHLQALGTRGGQLYGAASNYTDGWAVGVSTDGGLTFKPLTRYDQVKSIRSCAQATCYDKCLNLAGRQVWDKAVCDAAASSPPPPPPSPPPSSGCGCGTAPNPGAGVRAPAAAAGLLASTVALVSRRRRRQR